MSTVKDDQKLFLETHYYGKYLSKIDGIILYLYRNKNAKRSDVDRDA